MIGLIALFLPLVLSIVLAITIGGAAHRAAKKSLQDGTSFAKVVRKFVFVGAAVLIVASFVLALMFAAPTDTLDGEATIQEIIDYAKLQCGVMAIFFVPALLLALATGRQKKFEGDQT